MMNNRSTSQKLHEDLSHIIDSTHSGERLPSEPELARRLGVSRATLRESMRTFETQGLLRRRQGSGTYVEHPAKVIESGLEVLESISTMAQRIGLPVSMGDYKIDHRLASPEEMQALELAPESQVIHLARVILAEGRPAAYLIDIIPDDILSPGDLEEDFTGSVLDMFIQRYSLNSLSSRSEINAVTAAGDVARKLGIQRGDVLLRFIAYLYTSSGRVVDYSYSYFLPGYFRFHVVRRVG